MQFWVLIDENCKIIETGGLAADLEAVCRYFFHSALDEFGDFLFTEFPFVLLISRFAV